MSDSPPSVHDMLAGHYVLRRDIGDGRYLLKREIGRGGAATVYLAQDVRHERLVAIKLLHADLSHALGAQRFQREIKLTASLQHPHILPIHDSGQTNEQLYYVMPYVEGQSLRDRLGADNRLSIEEAVRIGRDVAGALAYAHERGVVHRDIKPENILFSGGHAIVADFGIARAIDRAHEQITQQGTITGTPAYMSPEQARDRAFDGRSDVYSLACVLYECIAGVPPFVGDTPQQQLSQRITRVPPRLREYRHDVPVPIESVVARALSMSPDDRYDDARAFSAALSAALGNSGETLSARGARRPSWQSPWLWAAGIALLLAGGAATTPPVREQLELLTTRVDSTQFAVVPFRHVGARAPASDAEPAAGGVYDAMRRWEGLKLASDAGVRTELLRLGAADGAHDLSDALAAARRVHAGRMVWGRVLVTPQQRVVRAALYDTRTSELRREVDMPLSGEISHADYRSLVARLLELPDLPSSARGSDRATSSYAAWMSYQLAQRSLAGWDVRGARAAFAQALAADPAYPQANLWAVQLDVWQNVSPAQWSPLVTAASRGRTQLSRREGVLLDALIALQRADYAAACGVYDGMRRADSLDVLAWIGGGLCRARDMLVVPAPGVPGKRAFRSSHFAASRAWSQALRIAPEASSVLTYDALRRVFYPEHAQMRIGTDAAGQRYGAFTTLAGDSVAQVPIPFAQFTAGVAAADPGGAVDRARDELLALYTSLANGLPTSPDPLEALARVLETRDELTGTPNGGHSAFSALARARSLSTDAAQRLRLGVAETRLYLKLGDFARAAGLADSLITANADARGDDAMTLAGLAAFTGRGGRAIAFLHAGGRSWYHLERVPPPLEHVASALTIRSALGICDDSLRALARQVEAGLDVYVSAERRTAARSGLLERPTMLAVPCRGPASALAHPSASSRLLRMQQMLARGESSGLRTQFDSLARIRAGARAGEASLDVVLQEAWLLAAIGDTAGAARYLDGSLTALPTLSSFTVTEPAIAASVGRSMAYRAELAAAVGDRGTATVWAGRVLTLWSRGDRSMEPTLARMRAIVTPKRRG